MKILIIYRFISLLTRLLSRSSWKNP